MRISPTGITISFGGVRGSTDDNRPVIARIFGFNANTSQSISCEMVIPAGEQVEQKLPKGIYSVQLTLPSGRILQRNVTIDEDTNENYQFFEDFAPNPSFSLQESAAQGTGKILADAALASGNTSSAEYEAAEQGPSETLRKSRGIHWFRRSGLRRIRMQGRPDERPVPARAQLFQTVGPIDIDGAVPHSPQGWRRTKPIDQRGNTALWRLQVARQGPVTESNRSWAKVELPNGRIEIASLPQPWFDVETGKNIPADVLVDPVRIGASTTIAVNDPKLSGLLAFLDRGQAQSAGPLLTQLEHDNVIERTIFSKKSNPLAACAAAYVGLAVYPPEQREVWDEWLENCMNWFPGIPDASIIHARRLMLRPSHKSDKVRAVEALRLACNAGLPFFSAGVFLLREMLTLLSVDHTDLARLVTPAGVLAGRVDASQAFTVLRYAPPRKVS